MNDTKRSDSDRALARLLAEALRRPDQPDAAACPDAELLAAYAERNLDALEAARWEKHFAECERCQKILAVLAVSAEEPLSESEVERFGRKVAAAELHAPAAPPQTAAGSKVASFKLPQPAWHWLAPAVGIAAAVALWIALRPTPPGPATTVAQQTVTQPAAPPDESLEARAKLPEPPAAAAAREAQAQRQKPLAPMESLKKGGQQAAEVKQVPQQAVSPAGAVAVAVPASQASAELQASNAPAENAGEARSADRLPAAAGAEAAPGAAGAAAPNAPAPAASFGAAPPPPNTAGQTAVSAAVPRPVAPQAGSSAAAQAEVAPAGAQAKASPNRAIQSFAARGPLGLVGGRAQVVVASPNRAVLWRLDPGGRIDRSTDQGQSWWPQGSSVTSDLLAGAAPSDRTAWIVGRAGVILLTTDGEHLVRVASPDATADWIAVEASDALHATVTSADRRRFVTDDGGVTWKQQ